MRREDFQGPEVGLLFLPFSLGPPFAKSQKMADFSVMAKSFITLRCRHILEARFAPKCCPMIALSAHTNYEVAQFVPRGFSRPSFSAIFPSSPLCKISENGIFWCFCQIFHNSSLRALLEARFAPKCFR